MSAHPLDKYFNVPDDNGPTDLDYEKGSGHPLDKYFNEPEERGAAAKTGRLATQYAIGIGERALLPYDLAMQSVASKEAGQVPYRENLFQDIERLQEQKQSGQWDEQDQKLYDSLIAQAGDTKKSEEFIKPVDLTVGGLAQKGADIFGVDLTPEGVLEHGARWAGMIKDPSKLTKLGLNLQSVKDVLPGFKDISRSLGAGAGLALAESGQFGPLGTMTAAIIGDLAGGGLSGLAKGATAFVKNPKATTAKVIGKASTIFKNPEKLKLQNDLNDAFKQAGVPIDVGTATGNRLVQFLQARMSQSALTGPALEDFKKEITDAFVKEYKGIADRLGEQKFQTAHEASTYGKQLLTEIRDADLASARGQYQNARELAKGQQATFGTPELAKKIKQLEDQLTPGSVKSADTKKVLTEIENLKKDLYDASGNVKPADVDALINNKINLNDMLNYEVQGGPKKLLEGVVKDIDDALKEYGRTQNKPFLKSYEGANKHFGKHAQTFRNKNLTAVLNPKNSPDVLMHKMNSPQGIKEVKAALSKTPEGKQYFKEIARFKLEELIGKNMVDSVSGQMKHGKFAKLLEDPLAKSIVKELLPSEDYSKLISLQARSGDLANTAIKFYNASQSGVGTTDFAIAAKVMWDMVNAFHGNPFPFINTVVGLTAANRLSKWFTDPEFIRIMQETMKAAESNNVPKIQKAASRMAEVARPTLEAGAQNLAQ